MSINWRHPLAQSALIHFSIILLTAILIFNSPPNTTKKIVRVDVYKVTKIVPKTLNLEPPKNARTKPLPLTSETKKVFGITKKSLTAPPPQLVSAEVKTGNTVAKEIDELKLDINDVDSLPIPADEYLVTAMPVLISEVRIPYPEVAKRAGIEGPVVMDLLIDEHGQVKHISLTKGPGFGLNEAAIAAIKNFQFRPAKIKDQSVAVKISYTYRFILENR